MYFMREAGIVECSFEEVAKTALAKVQVGVGGSGAYKLGHEQN